MMSNDPNDEIIDDNASLKTGVAKKIVSLFLPLTLTIVLSQINNELKVRLMQQAFKLHTTVDEDNNDG